MLRRLLTLYDYPVTDDALYDIFTLLHVTVPADTGQECWRFGVSELSLSFDRRSTPHVRALAEVLTRKIAAASDAAILRQIGWRLFDRLALLTTAPYDRTLFSDLVQIAYDWQETEISKGPLRFGLAIDWCIDRPPSVKCYYDLFAGGKYGAQDRLALVFERLGFDQQWQALQQLALTEGATFTCRGIGIDYSPGGKRNVRLYLPGSRFTMGHIKRLLASCGSSDLTWQFDLFNTHLMGALSDRDAVRSMILGLVYAESLVPEQPVFKLDAYLPNQHIDDLAASRAFMDLATALDVPVPGYADALRIVATDLPLSDVQRIQQYCSLDVFAEPKLNLYFRPLGSGSDHTGATQRARLKPRLLQALDRACREAIVVLEHERTAGYARATHSMQFPRAAGFSGPSELQKGRVFQTALIDWAGIAADIEDLAQMRCQDVRGGWRYFPQLSELPPDADDLAQVMQLLLLARSSRVDELCSDALDLVFQNAHPDGSFETWIVDPTHASSTRQKILQAITTWWGSGPDPEVMANLVYTLSLRGDTRYLDHAHRAAEYLAGRQLPDGSWSSTWYCGPFYGTWVCTRAIHTTLPQHHVLGKTASYLWETQHADGGWGNGMSNPTSTALALNAALLLQNGANTVTRAVDYLLDEQQDDRLWRGDAFIQMDPLRAQPDMAGQIQITYRSNVITTALCLQALCAARPVLE